MSQCRCAYVPYVDAEICAATGGQCVPDDVLDVLLPDSPSTGFPEPGEGQVPPRASMCDERPLSRQEWQYLVQVPYEVALVSELEDPRARQWIWE